MGLDDLPDYVVVYAKDKSGEYKNRRVVVDVRLLISKGADGIVLEAEAKDAVGTPYWTRTDTNPVGAIIVAGDTHSEKMKAKKNELLALGLLHLIEKKDVVWKTENNKRVTEITLT